METFAGDKNWYSIFKTVERLSCWSEIILQADFNFITRSCKLIIGCISTSTTNIFVYGKIIFNSREIELILL